MTSNENNMAVHNHGIDPSCPEERQPDGSLKGACMTTSNESKTPETDAAAFHDDGHDPESFVVSYDFAAGLEIERNALRAKLAAPVDGLPEGCPTTIQWCPVCKRLGGHWSFHQDGGMVTLELAPVGARDRLAALEGVNPPKGAAKDSTLGHAS